MSNLLGKALLDYIESGEDSDIIILNSLGEEDTVPVSYFFRPYAKMPAIEQKALDLARGTVLDIGAGAGSHSLYLGQKGHETLALDSSPDAVTCCAKRGLDNCVCSSIQEFNSGTYDTLLMLMNGVGVAGSFIQLEKLLLHLSSLMNTNGQILLDSSDIRYMFETDEARKPLRPDAAGYYGDILFSVYYKGEFEPPFPWVYVDFESLSQAAKHAGLKAEKVMDGPHFDYLARLTRD